VRFDDALDDTDVHRVAPGGDILATAVAPVILVDELGFPDLSLGAAFGNAQARQWLRTTRVGGFQPSSRMPKPVDWALEAGSAALVSPDTPLTPRFVGERTVEGYGLVVGLTPGTALRASDRGWHVTPAVDTLSQPEPARANPGASPLREAVQAVLDTQTGPVLRDLRNWLVKALRGVLATGPDGQQVATNRLLDEPLPARLAAGVRRQIRELLDADRAELTVLLEHAEAARRQAHA
jgi:hypothetical protein